MSLTPEIAAARVRTVTLSLPRNVAIERITFVQDADSNQSGADYQRLEVVVEDAGGGSFLTLKTERWAMDDVDLPTMCAALVTLVQERMP